MDFSTMVLRYGATFGKGDGSDLFDWEVELTDEQQEIFKRSVMTGQSIDDIEEFKPLIDEAYDEIKEEETSNMLSMGEEYAMECMGEVEVDADELNELVRSGDKHAIEFLGLQNLSEEERQEWDSLENLDELPLIKDFDPDFEPSSPFDEGWSLGVYAPDIDEIELEDSEIDDYIAEAFDKQDYELVSQVLDAQEDYYSGDIWEEAELIAKEKGCIDLFNKKCKQQREKRRNHK